MKTLRVHSSSLRGCRRLDLMLLAVVSFLPAIGCRQEPPPAAEDKDATAAAVTMDKPASSPLAATVGDEACMFCHRSEHLAWHDSMHANLRVKIENYSGQVQRFAEALNLSAEDIVSKNDRCVRCHGTAQSTKDGAFHIIAGVSCESCHGNAGGKDSWLNLHAVTHDPKDPLDKPETPELYKKRVSDCLQRGMIRTANVYDIAKNCQSCHYVSDQELVNAGHPAWHLIGSDTPFELVLWSSGEVRHNFHMDVFHNSEVSSLWQQQTGGSVQQRRRTAFLVGQLAELEVCLQNLADVKAGEEGSNFASANQERLEEQLLISLQEMQAVLADAAPEQLTVCVNAAKAVLAADEPTAEAKKHVAGVAQAARSLAESKPAAWHDKLAEHPAVYDFELAFAMVESKANGNQTDGQRGAQFLRTRLKNLQFAIRNAGLIPEDDEEREDAREKLLEQRIEMWLASVDGIDELVGEEVAELMGGAMEAAETVSGGDDPKEALEMVTEALEAMNEMTDLSQFAGAQKRIDTWVGEEIGIVGKPYKRR